MMIDASLGRTNCCGCGQYPVQPPVAPNPPVPQPRTEPDAITVQLGTAQTALANGAAIPLTGTVRQIGDGLTYDAANHAVVVNEPGVYLFQWHAIVQPEGTPDSAVLALQSLDGQTVLGYSGTVIGGETNGVSISGATVAAVPAGSAWALVNASGTAVNIPVAGTAPAAFAASLTVTEVGSSNTAAAPVPAHPGCGCMMQPR